MDKFREEMLILRWTLVLIQFIFLKKILYWAHHKTAEVTTLNKQWIFQYLIIKVNR
jgi:hypothetical protein